MNAPVAFSAVRGGGGSCQVAEISSKLFKMGCKNIIWKRKNDNSVKF